ncbi:MAG: hypothetical protein AAF493_24710 [Pseudomonadota bacterium]
MAVSYSDMKETSFNVRAVAPADVIQDYATCKAVWFAEHKKAETIVLGAPIFGSEPDSNVAVPGVGPSWI